MPLGKNVWLIDVCSGMNVFFQNYRSVCMRTTVTEKPEQNRTIRKVLNSMLSSIKVVVPVEYTTRQPKALDNKVHLSYGVFIGMTGDLKGKVLFTGEEKIFSTIGKKMFGTEPSGEMLHSFCGELGNMLAGSLATIIATDEININITTPTIMDGDTSLTGYKHGIDVPIDFQDVGKMNVHFLFD